MKNIFKNFILLFISVMITGLFNTITAQIADERTVSCVAKNVFYERAISAGYTISPPMLEDYKISHQNNLNNEPVFYVFNFEIGGWVIIASDMSIDPIIGYNFSETFELESLPLPLNDLLIENAKLYQFKDNKTIHPNWIKYSNQAYTMQNVSTVGPLVQLAWGQHGGYNDHCPMINTTNHGYVGCGPLAMGMIIAYHNYPNNACAYNSNGGIEQWTNCVYSNPSLIVIDYLNRDYNWNQMSMTHPDVNNRKLLFHCGIMANACYQTSYTSIKYPAQLYTAMVENFKYKYNPASKVFKGEYTIDEFSQILKDEIDYDRPILAFLVKGSNGNGHVIVISGYQATYEFHINWGYFGTSNGYYNINNPLVDPLSPNEQYNISSINRFIEPRARKKMSVHKNFESTTNQTFIASELITIVSEVKNGAQINLFSRKRVKMLPGFKVDNNSRFRAYTGLAPLEPNCGAGYDPYAITDFNAFAKNKENKNMGLMAEHQKELQAINDLIISPNPAYGMANLHIPHASEVLSVIITNTFNQKVFELEHIQQDNELNLNFLPKGLYLIYINSVNGTQIRKLILQ